jgi:rhodanese-related sulfurtransferase
MNNRLEVSAMTIHGSVPTVSIDGVPNPLPAGLTVIDVREPIEWQYGHIEGAIHIPLMELPERLDEVPETQTLVVCKVGGRSGQAVMWLNHQGRHTVNLDGGMVEWADAGRPMVSETGAEPLVV